MTQPYPFQLKIALDLLVGAIIFCAGALSGWYYTNASAPAPTQTWTTAKPAPQVAAIPTQQIKPPSVKVYTARAKQTLQLPDTVKSDPNLYVLQSTRLPKDTHPVTVTSLIDSTTGDTQTMIREEPLPWFAIEQTGEARIDIGIKGASTIGRLSVREDLLQVKGFHAGINASLDSDGEIFAGVGVGYKW